jgi:hypothetical protein
MKQSAQSASDDTATQTFRHEGTLPFGYENRDLQNKKELHQRFVFGKRPTGSDLLQISRRRESQIATQSALMYVRAALIEFGSLGKPPLSVLLSLNEVDRDVLLGEYDRFLQLSGGERVVQELSESAVKLPFGLEVDGVLYDVIEFGGLLTGYQQVELERTGASGLELNCLSLIKQIKSVRQSEGKQRLNRALTLEDFESMDGQDITSLLEANSQWVDSFRRPRTTMATAARLGNVGDSSPSAGSIVD